MMAFEERLIEIEKKISHQDFSIDELNEIVQTQMKDISLLMKRIQFLENLANTQDAAEQMPEKEEKPPHY